MDRCGRGDHTLRGTPSLQMSLSYDLEARHQRRAGERRHETQCDYSRLPKANVIQTVDIALTPLVGADREQGATEDALQIEQRTVEHEEAGAVAFYRDL